jgi:predicted dehydrogenase/threonine dehydrogenase-like Zn-dependent dehydrogenase
VKAVIQNYRTGVLEVAEVPAPALRGGGALVRTRISVVSAGTEKLMVDLARKSLVGKARERPDLVGQVIGKVRRDGLLPTLETVRRRLDTPIPLGYSSAGTVLEVGQGVRGVAPGDLVACAGAGHASHAEVVYVPRNLLARVPEGVTAETAAFTTLGAIALQGIRLAEPRLGETGVVIGLGLLGLLAVQLLAASGCRVLGMDPDPERCRLALSLGAVEATSDQEALTEAAERLTAGHGADLVLVTAGTRSSGPVALAGELARVNGRVVAVGAVGLDLPRKPYYDKELVFRVSRSYGPGRYDADYEERGRDYPYGYVRWTENRNMEAFLGQAAAGRVTVAPLVTHRYAIGEAGKAYELISGSGKEPYLGILLTYPEEPEVTGRIRLAGGDTPRAGGGEGVTIGFLGAGSFATGVLIPALKKAGGIGLGGVCTSSGVSARHAAATFGFPYATTDQGEILGDPAVNAVAVCTRHHLHARQVVAALRAGKHVFVEKPLCLTPEELREITDLLRSPEQAPLLMVGYNRRFAPLAVAMREFLAGGREPLAVHYRVNAGPIPHGHWVHDPESGGGRIVGEVCHFVDFLIWLTGSLPAAIHASVLPDGGRYRRDNLAVLLTLADGSAGTISYTANGDKAFPKERVEASGGGRVAVLDNFRSLELWKNGRRTVSRSRFSQEKGHRQEWEAFRRAVVENLPSPTPLEQVVAGMEMIFRIAHG